GGESPGGGGGGSGGDRLFVVLSWLAQVNVQVNESGGDDQAASVEFFVGAATNFVGQSDLGDAAVAQQHVHGGVDLRRGIDQVAAFNEETLVFLTVHPQLPGNFFSADSRGFRGFFLSWLNPRASACIRGIEVASLTSPSLAPAPESPCVWGHRCGLRQ